MEINTLLIVEASMICHSKAQLDPSIIAVIRDGKTTRVPGQARDKIKMNMLVMVKQNVSFEACSTKTAIFIVNSRTAITNGIAGIIGGTISRRDDMRYGPQIAGADNDSIGARCSL